MKKILITGGLGYIGSHTAVELVDCGYEVVLVDNLSNSEISMLANIEQIVNKKIEFYQKDLLDKKEMEEVFEKNKDIEAIIHFAASKAVAESVRLPLKYYKNNLLSLLNILEAMKERKIKNIILSSSACVYGQPDEIPVTENTPIKKATNPYGNTKQIKEEIIGDFCESDDIRAISLRYFNPIGAHKSKKIGELPKGSPENLLPYITQVAAGAREGLKIFGDDYDTHDGTGVRDYIHVVDLAKAHIKALERLLKRKNKKNHEIFNLGTGKGYSVLDLVNKFQEVSGIKLKYKIMKRRAGDIDEIYTDPKLASKELGWKAEHNLEEMLRSAWEWEKRIRNITD